MSLVSVRLAGVYLSDPAVGVLHEWFKFSSFPFRALLPASQPGVWFGNIFPASRPELPLPNLTPSFAAGGASKMTFRLRNRKHVPVSPFRLRSRKSMTYSPPGFAAGSVILEVPLLLALLALQLGAKYLPPFGLRSQRSHSLLSSWLHGWECD